MKRKVNKIKQFFVGVGLMLLLVAGAVVFAKDSSAFSNPRPQVIVNLAGTVERDQIKSDLSKIEAVKPNEIISWTIVSENKGDGIANNYKAIGKIPAGTVLVEKSAQTDGEAMITYSIDGGKSFSQQPMIEEKQKDGSVKMIPAPIGMYSQIRFEWNTPLNPNEKRNATYQVLVR